MSKISQLWKPFDTKIKDSDISDILIYVRSNTGNSVVVNSPNFPKGEIRELINILKDEVGDVTN